MGMSKGLFFFLTQKTSKQETQLAESFLGNNSSSVNWLILSENFWPAAVGGS